MNYRSLFFGLTLAGGLAAAGAAHGAQGSQNRDPHVCLGGVNAGQACTDNSQCPQSKCEVNYLSGPGTMFHAELTLIADDDVSKWDGTEEVTNVVAVTILLKTRFKGKEYFLAQTYQNLAGGDLATLMTNLQTGPILADTNLSRGPVTEEKLNDALDEGFIGNDPTKSLLDDLLWQEGDSPIADELRGIFGVSGGKPILVGVPKTLAGVKHSDYEASGLASVARLKVTFRFVPTP